MSLINQMLKDLEQQRQKSKHVSEKILRGLSSVSIVKRSLLLTYSQWLLAILLVAGLLLLPGWFLWTKSQALATPPYIEAILEGQIAAANTQAKQELLVDKSVTQRAGSFETAPEAMAVDPIEPSPIESEVDPEPKPVAVPAVEAPVVTKVIRTETPEEKRELSYLRIMQQLELGQNQQAINALREMLRRYPNYIPARQSLVNLYINYGELELALNTLVQVEPRIQEYPDYYALMAALYEQLKQPQMAAQIYQQLLEVQPGNGVWWMGLGIALEDLQQPAAARDAYQKALRSHSLSTQVRAYVTERFEWLTG